MAKKKPAKPTEYIPHTKRVKGIKRPWEDVFLEHLAFTYNVVASCKKAGVSRSAAYRKRWENERFAREWDEALEVGAVTLEAEAIRRSVEGVLEPVFYQGEVVGHIRKYSDQVLMFLLRGAMPEKYRERHELSGRVDGNLTISTVAALDAIYGDKSDAESAETAEPASPPEQPDTGDGESDGA